MKSKAWHSECWIYAMILTIATTIFPSTGLMAADAVTTVYIVRHAEKADLSENPPLSSAGMARAKTLAHVLSNAGIDAVFATNFVRTQQTGAPTASAAKVKLQIYQADDPQSVVDLVLSDHIGDEVLVVGHSVTVDDIAGRLGASGLSDLEEDQFDRLFIVHLIGTTVHLERLRYGVATR